MTDRCEKCGRLVPARYGMGGSLSGDPETHCLNEGGRWCRIISDAYRRGLREGVELAKGEACITEDTHFVPGMGHVHEIDWTDVDAELERRLK